MMFKPLLMKAKRLVFKAGRWIYAHRAEICTGLSVIGTIGTGISAFRAGGRCHEILSEAGGAESLGDELALTWQELIWPIVIGTGTIVANLYGSHLYKTTIDGLVLANGILLGKYNDLKEEYIEQAGEDQYEEAMARIADKNRRAKLNEENKGVIVFDPDGELYYDAHTMLWFRQDPDIVHSAWYKVNRQIQAEGFGSIGTLFEGYGFHPKVDIPQDWYLLGWEHTRLVNSAIGIAWLDFHTEKGAEANTFPFTTFAPAVVPDDEDDNYTIIDYSLPPMYASEMVSKRNDFFRAKSSSYYR